MQFHVLDFSPLLKVLFENLSIYNFEITAFFRGELHVNDLLACVLLWIFFFTPVYEWLFYFVLFAKFWPFENS